ncbi:tetratricopeptide (TPR) repeat protein [Altererythrobacter atlanticus]|uniref:Tetratricopeptide repeat protein n=1 Tax=Croceibacterium atlanticum TaxID=1267766 RepID=A0A0F7KLK9_9SPHN|nr:tetratricopeptide repeat protein [Croceibacterium atlanticum]AKH41433.1 tetratricopeptide repeat protein [Croceibacterium atlanticum]MBB5732895.1 tetratricopeptide (TPR) repeat protein [Croceibacterium atlanticum]
MICRADRRILLSALALLALAPASAAGPGVAALEKARAAIERRDGIAAEVAAKQALDAGIPRASVAAFMGEAELIAGDLDQAREWLGPGEFDDATWQQGFHALARLEMAEGDIDAASAAFDRALEKGKGSATLWVDIGRLRYRAGQHHKALNAAVKALEADPKDPRALEFRAQLERDSAGLIAALPWYERALEIAPDDLGLLGGYAATLGEAGRARDMLGTVRRMIELDGGNPRAYYLQAVLAARAGKTDLARKLMWRTDGAFDQLPAGMLLNGVLEMQMGNARLAMEQFDRLIRMQPDNVAAKELLGRALLANGEANVVIARLAPLADRDDASPYLLTLVGRAHEQMGQRAEAAPYLDRAAAGRPTGIHVMPNGPAAELTIWRWRDDPDRAEVAVPLLRKLLAEGRAEEARRHAAKLIERYPDSADIEVLAGDVALLAGAPGDALPLYAEAARIRFDRPLVQRMVAASLAAGQRHRARELLETYLAGNPRDAIMASWLGQFLADDGYWGRAQDLLFHASRIGGGRDPYLLADLAAAELRTGGNSAARSNAAHAYGLQRANGAVAAVLARTIDRVGGDNESARTLFAKAEALSRPTTLAGR